MNRSSSLRSILVALALLVLAAGGGCNQILGNEPPSEDLGGQGGNDESGTGGLGGSDGNGDGGTGPGDGGSEGDGGTGPGDGGSEGDGGTGGGSMDDTTPPELVSTAPEGPLLDGRAVVVVTFDEEVEAAAGDLTVLLDGVVAVEGGLEVDGVELRFVPDEPFDEPGTYTVELTDGIADPSGNAFAGDSFEFTLEPGNGQKDNVRLDTMGSGDVSCPHLVSDSAGNAAVLYQKGGELFTRFYAAGEGWDEPVSLGAGSQGVLRMSPSGRLVVAYTATVGGDPHTLVRTATATDPTWSTAVVADEGSANVIVTQSTCSLREQDKNVALNDQGALAVIWRSTALSGAFVETWSHAIKPAGEAFMPAVDVTNGEGELEPDAMPGVAIDSSGNAMITFMWDDTGYSEIKTREFASSSGNWLGLKHVTVAGAPPWLDIDADDNFVLMYDRYIEGYGNEFRVEVFPFLGSDADDLVYDGPGAGAFLQTRGNTWVVWEEGMGLRQGADPPWDVGTPDLDAVTLPVVVDLEPTLTERNRALVAWQDGGVLEWALVNEVDEYYLIDIDVEDGPYAFPGLAAAPREVRLVYDGVSRHGIAVWLEEVSGETVLTTSDFFMQPGQ